MSGLSLDAAQLGRAVGAVLGSAAGDALGAGYEFGPPLPDSEPVEMKGGGQFDWAPGEWTDDTSMAVPLLRAVADGRDLRSSTVLDEVVAEWARWAETAPDVGIQTRRVLGGLRAPTAEAARESALRLHESTGRSGGNGSLMRTAPVVLGYLSSESALEEAARAVSALTHVDEDAADACVLWCLAIRHAILTGEVSAEVGLPAVGSVWGSRLSVAASAAPRDFANNGWVVEALQGAWSALSGASGYVDAVERAVRGGRDTDTVAAIAGALAGAGAGASAVPTAWVDVLHGWPGMRASDLRELAVAAVSR